MFPLPLHGGTRCLEGRGRESDFKGFAFFFVHTTNPFRRPTSCASPHLYAKGANGVTDNIVGISYTFDDPSGGNAKWYGGCSSYIYIYLFFLFNCVVFNRYTSFNSPMSTCTWKFGGTEEDGNGQAACTANFAACNRCQFRGPCLCDRMATGVNAQSFPVWYQFSYQDGNDVVEHSGVLGPSSIPVEHTTADGGSAGCPVDYTKPGVLSQLSAQPTVNLNE